MRYCLYLLLLLLAPALFAQQPADQPLRIKAASLKVFLDKNHYQPISWNDSASARLYNRWMYVLDDDKDLFIQDDVNALKAFQYQLDEELNGQSWAFFDKSVALLKKAVKRYDSLQRLVLSKPVDFTKTDNFKFPSTNYAASLADLQQRITRYTRWKIVRMIASELDRKDSLDVYLNKLPADFAAREKKAREKIKQQHNAMVNSMGIAAPDFISEKGEDYLKAIAWCYDPHSTYMSIGDKKDFTTALSGFEYSTGMDIEEDEDGSFVVNRLEPGGSAWRSGELHKGDKVIKIKKGGKEEQDLEQMDEDEVGELLKGNSDEAVELTVKTAGGVEKKVALTKEKVTDDEGIVKSYLVRGVQNYGYIQLPGFYSRESESISSEEDVKYDGCANDVSKEVLKLKRDSIAGLIIDLRFNGGGSMWEAMQLAGIFIDYGPVASVKDKTGKVRFLKDPNRGSIYDGPLLVLINSGSASASELVSAMLQDYNRALIVGSTSYGKGTAQIVLPMDTAFDEKAKRNYDDFKDFVKVTEEKFYRVDGSTTQWKGVVPDIALPDLYEDPNSRERSVVSALLPDNTKKGIYQPLTGIPIASLKDKSLLRTSVDSTFKSIQSINQWVQNFTVNRDVQLEWKAYVTNYRNTLDIFKKAQLLTGFEKALLKVSNTNFDQDKIRFASPGGQQLNKAYLRRIAGDAYIAEACSILQDWINTK